MSDSFLAFLLLEVLVGFLLFLAPRVTPELARESLVLLPAGFRFFFFVLTAATNTSNIRYGGDSPHYKWQKNIYQTILN